MNNSTRAFALIGPGRAGSTVTSALLARGWTLTGVAGRSAAAPSTLGASRRFGVAARDVAHVGADADVLIIATPDAAISDAARVAAPALPRGALLLHLSGALGLDVFDHALQLRPDVRGVALHPLVSLSSAESPLDRLEGAWCAVAGDDDVYDLAAALGMVPFSLATSDRALYHATAAIASNHFVALLGQVERLAQLSGVPFEAFLRLVQVTLDNVSEQGPSAALTGPVARGDVVTIERHLAALPAEEQAAYRALARCALQLSERNDPALEAVVG